MLGIVFTIIGIAAIIVFAIQVYKTAVSTEHNAPLWTGATVLIGLAVQYVLPFFSGLAIGIFYVLSHRPLENLGADMFGVFTIIDIAALVLSLIAMGRVMKHVGKIKDDDHSSPYQPPPPPPSF
jgi:hypothetical protein